MNSDMISLMAATVLEPARRFALFGPLHLAILAATVLTPLGLWAVSRGRPVLARIICTTLAVGLLLDRLLVVVWAFHLGRIAAWPEALPMHLCDWAVFVVGAALLHRADVFRFGNGQLVYELAYFWGLGGTLQAVLTPDTAEDPGSPFFISFFLSHCGIIASVLFLTLRFGLRPARGAVWRAWGWSQFYLLCAGAVNWLAGTNFGYLARKPRQSSLLDLLGPWPWYLLVLEALALVLFTLLDLPFWRTRRPRRAAPSGP